MNRAFIAASVLWGLAGGGAAAQHAMMPYAAVPFAPDADVGCLSSALETGNPSAGASTWLLKATPGCVVPWHWHTAQEQLMVVSGDVMAEMTGQPATLLGAGGFAVMAGNMAHQFTCQGGGPCVMFITFDGAYDIKWERDRP